MAALGSIGIQPLTAKRLIPVTAGLATATGTIRGRSPLTRCIFDIADARNAKLAFIRIFVNDHWRVTEGRRALYLDQFTMVAGTVKNSAGTGIARDVVITNRLGQCVGRKRSASDGTFTIILDNQGTSVVLCQAIPDAGDNRNAVVKWNVVPIAIP